MEAITKMKRGSKWPRPEYLVSDIGRDVIELMLVDHDENTVRQLKHIIMQSSLDARELCAELIRLRSMLSNWEDIVQEIVLSDQEIIDMWKQKSLFASTAGTWTHAMLEHMMNGFHVSPGCMSDELDMAIDFLSSVREEYPASVVFRTEWTIYAVKEDLAGSIDLVLQDPNDDNLILIDWKRSEKLPEKYSGYGRFMQEPLSSVPDCQGEHYRLQLNLYKWVLESYYSKKVKDMRVVCVHKNPSKEAFVDKVPDMSEVVSNLMRQRRESLQPAEPTFSQIPDTTDLAEEIKIAQALAPTVPFEVAHSQRRLSQACSDVNQDLEPPVDNCDENRDDKFPDFLKKRRAIKGADKSALLFEQMFAASHKLLQCTLDVTPADVRATSDCVLKITSTTIADVTEAQPTWSADLVRLVVVAAHLCRCRVQDRPMLADCAALLWMMEGERHIRVHNGFLYVYDDDGTFVPFGGVPPETVLRRVYLFCSRLEGLLLLLPTRTRRDPQVVLDAVAAKRQEFVSESEFLERCASAVLQGPSNSDQYERLDSIPMGDEGNEGGARQRGDSEPWTIALAAKVWKLSCAIRNELMYTKLISLLVEWCETPDKRERCVCYEDLCLRYDSDLLVPVTVVPKSSANNCYIKIPHAIKDPVLEANVLRLQKFYSQTFWCNAHVFKCCQAAIALAKRGLNVDRCFIGISPGGVGQSLYSQHIAAMFGNNHAFFDPNVWHNDEELRKQVESFARCFIITGQEAPESARKLHLDLYKKTMSADGIVGRKPYGYTTRMFTIVGWTLGKHGVFC